MQFTIDDLLPDPPADAKTSTVSGKEAADRLSPRARGIVDALTTLGRRAAQRYNE